MTISLGAGAGGQFIGVCLSGFTLLFVLHTSDARRADVSGCSRHRRDRGGRRRSRSAGRADYGSTAAGLIGLLLAFAAPVIILRRILASPRITVRLVLGALAIYLLVGLTYAYLYPVIGTLTNQQFFVQTKNPAAIDYVYFSYVTLTTVGYGDFTASTSVGRMAAVSEALTGQLYLVSAVALLVGNIGRTIVRGGIGAQMSSSGQTAKVEDETTRCLTLRSRVLFVCTGNSARSQIAEAILGRIGGDDFAVFSAGTEPKGVNPYTVRVLDEEGIDWSSARSKSVQEFLGQPFDYVITVCDNARQTCPVFPGSHEKLHWDLEDPAEVEGSDDRKLAAFRETYRELDELIRPFVETALRTAGRADRAAT